MVAMVANRVRERVSQAHASLEDVGTSGADFAVVIVNSSALTYNKKAENASTRIRGRTLT